MEKKLKIVTLKINSHKIISIFITILFVLVITSVITQAVRFFVLNDEIYKFARFNLDEEANIPTYFSTVMLLFISFLLGGIAFLKKVEEDPYKIYWIVLSIIFLTMSFDEAAALHEMIIKPLRILLNSGGFFYYTWIIPATIFFAIISILFFKFWWNLRSDIKMLFAISAIFYISGAIVFEGIGGFYRELNGKLNFTYNMITTIEETLELIGCLLFIYTLLRYLKNFYPHVGLKIKFL